MWHNKYIGIPYVNKGRSIEGADCYGLARIIYKEEYGIDLPSFSGDYVMEDKERIQELVSQYKEGWEKLDTPKEGAIALFRILGHISHIGVMISDTKFIHTKRNQAASIESLNSPKWVNRFVGSYTYTDQSKNLFNNTPKELKAHKLDVPEGISIQDALDALIKNAEIPEYLHSSIILYLNSTPVDTSTDKSLKLAAGDILEYRMVQQDGDVGRNLLTLAVVVGVSMIAPGLGTYLAGAGASATTVLGWQAASALALQYVGMALVNAIAPIRPPDTPTLSDPGSSNPQLMLNGTRNESRAYGSIPVVLGKYRINAVLAASNVLEINTDTSYLRMLLNWGYGPVYKEDVRVGATSLGSYNEYDYRDTMGYAGESKAHLYNSYGWGDTYQEVVNVELSLEAGWVSRTLPNKATSITVGLHFPEGLRGIYREGGSAGAIFSTLYSGEVQIRQLNDSLVPITGWLDTNSSFGSTNLVLQLGTSESYKTGYEQGYGDNYNLVTTYTPAFYRWNYIYLTTGGAISSSFGGLYSADYAINSAIWPTSPAPIYPAIPAGAKLLYRVRASATSFTNIEDNRGGTISGANLSVLSVNTVNISAGTLTAPASIYWGLPGTPYDQRKDAFSHTIRFDNLAESFYEVRTRRTNSSESDFNTSANKPYLYHKCIFQMVTAVDGTTQPILAPSSIPLSLSSLRVRATDQLNGGIDAINALVYSICLDYDINSDTWVSRTTSNPASLFRYVLQHPGNMQKVPDSEIDLNNLKVWHNFCRVNAFEYNGVLVEQRSLLEVMRDICAAGRASPMKVNSKWVAVIDTYRTEVTQHFTPVNSWGFESSRSLSIFPHALKVTFINESRDFQSEEVIVYSDGYNASNASIFETIQLPGVTDYSSVYRHARFHLAQAKLRPEKYSINTDMEYLVCSRGDLVKVTHDIPMWGSYSGRINDYVSTTDSFSTIKLDEPIYLVSTTGYSIRIRNNTGETVLRSISAVPSTGDYRNITVYPAITSAQGAFGNLYMIGENTKESADLIVLSIEPSSNNTAKISLCDYSPAIFVADTASIPEFSTNITRLPKRLNDTILSIPIVYTSEIKSDESVMEISGTSYLYKLVIPFTNPTNLETLATRVQIRLCLTSDTSETWRTYVDTTSSAGVISIRDVVENSSYTLQIRYVGELGSVGPWSEEFVHTIIGRTNPPSNVGSFAISGSVLTWQKVGDLDVTGYIIKYHYGTNFDWNNAIPLHYGVVTDSPFNIIAKPSGVVTIMIKAIDSLNIESKVTSNIIANLGDVTVSNIIETIDFKAQGFPGTITNSTIIDGNLLADYATSFYSSENTSFYGQGNESFYSDTKYKEVVYLTPEYYISNIIENTTGILNVDYEGASLFVEYRGIGLNPFYAAGPFYGEGTDSFYGAPTEWAPLPASFVFSKDYYQFRITIGGGAQQGKLLGFQILLDVQDLVESLDDVPISITGTTIPYTKNFTAIRNIQATLQQNLSGAVRVEIDKTDAMAPIIRAYNDSNVLVSGATADITIKGY